MTHTTRAPRERKESTPSARPARQAEGAFTLLRPELQKAVLSQGYQRPTPIQEQAIPPLLEGRDMIGMAQTGTGKTAAFCLPLLQRLEEEDQPARPSSPQALVLAPTRELASQINESVHVYGRYLRIRHAVLFGGVSQRPQEAALLRRPKILVATPGRLLDLLNQRLLHLDDVRYFVLDEVDRMLDMGFIHDIRKVVAAIPSERQTLFFSATLPPALLRMAQGLVKDPVQVQIEPEAPAVERIDQKVLFVRKEDKVRLLVDVLQGEGYSKAIVFTQMKHVANRVVKKLAGAGIEGAAIHGNKSQGARTRALDSFRSGSLRVLVATDLAARGLDVDEVTHVINYDLPVEAETYVHRIGRTARAGADGDAISFCCEEDHEQLHAIEKLLGKAVPRELEHAFHSEACVAPAYTPSARSGRSAGGNAPAAGRPRGSGSRAGDSRGGASRGGDDRGKASGAARSSSRRRRGRRRQGGGGGGAAGQA